MIFFAVLRMMDELKDYEKDLVAHPERPLPRGVLKPAQVETAIHSIVGFMVAFGVAVLFLNNVHSGVLYLATTLYLWLMYKEFYTGGGLANIAWLYGTTHQLVIVLLCLYAVTVARPDLIIDPLAWAWSFSVLGSFFCYEICRKLDPDAHPILKTYLHMYRPGGTIFFVLCTSLVAFIADWYLGLAWLLWPFQALVVFTLPLVKMKPKRYKIVEGATVLGLLIHLWGVTLIHFKGAP